MHGLNHSFIPAFERPEAARSAKDKLLGMRNLLPLEPANAFGNGRNSADLRKLMRKLATRITYEQSWPDALPNARNNEDNPTIPSGYTYLLQLIAHDIVNTSVSLAASGGRFFGFENARLRALTLDTIYGGGPDVCPHAYELSELCLQHRDQVPRTRLRLGRISHNGSTAEQPFDDIGRGTPIETGDDGIPAPEKVQDCLRSEALVADPRNDDHALISQLTVLFHRLHNHMVEIVEGSMKADDPAKAAYHAFIFTRFILALIYRRIIIYDVLRRLLDPSVFRYYVLDNHALVTDHGEGVPVEFAYGAFRCGHAMIRDGYRIDSDTEEQPAGAALLQSSRRTPTFLPVSDVWKVRWGRFFPPNGNLVGANFSRRLGPSFSSVTRNGFFFPGPLPDDAPGIPSRDLVSAVYSHVWSVPALIDALRAKRPALSGFLKPYGTYQTQLAAWLKTPDAIGNPALEPDEVAAVAADPPLPFFVLFEAALTSNSTAKPFVGGGQHLGPLGSIIVAETILGAMLDHPLQIGTSELDPKKKLKELWPTFELMGIDEKVLSQLPEDIQSMPDLLSFMRDRDILGE
jgi:Animal haem peroxidase